MLLAGGTVACAIVALWRGKMKLVFSAGQRIDLQGSPIQLCAETVQESMGDPPTKFLAILIDPITSIDRLEEAFKGFIEGARREEGIRHTGRYAPRAVEIKDA